MRLQSHFLHKSVGDRLQLGAIRMPVVPRAIKTALAVPTRDMELTEDIHS